MAKGGSSKKGAAQKDTAEDGSGWSMDAIPEALRDAGKRAAELAQNPYARSLLAAGLVAAAAALATNKNVRDTTRKNLKAATDVAEVGAENVGKVGIAIVNAATEAVQRMIGLGGLAEAEPATKRGGAKGKAKSGTAAKASRATSGTKKGAAKAATTPKAATTRKAPAKTATKAATAKAPAKRAAPKSASTRTRKTPATSKPASGRDEG